MEPIADVVKPGAYLPDPLVGQKVSASGSWIPGDFIVVSSRFNDDVQGYWVTGQFRLDEASSASTTPTSLAVAVGWAATREEADAAASALSTHVENDPLARFEAHRSPDLRRGDGGPPRGRRPDGASRGCRLPRCSAAGHDTAGLDVYRPYLTSAEPLDGLTAISSPAPVEGSGVNWLNIFYAVEWAVFAGFAFYLWYRLAKDAWEREVEALEEDA